MPCERCQSSAGFTIIEVLVALAIVAAALAAIGSLMATTARGTRSLEQHLALVQTARAVATGLPKRDQLAIGSLAGEIAAHRWRMEVLPFSVGDIGPTAETPWVPHAIVIRVQSPSGAVLELDTVRLYRRSGG